MYNMLRKLREERAEGDRGFTLIELLVVVVIIGILVAIAIPIYLNYEHGAQNKSAESDARNAAAVIEQCMSDNNGTLSGVTLPTGGQTANVPLTCGTGNTETIVVSSGNTMTLTTPDASGPTGSYQIEVSSSNGANFFYHSTTGKVGPSGVVASPTSSHA